MASTPSSIDQLIKQVEDQAAAKNKPTTTAKPTLPPGATIDDTGTYWNIFGIDNRMPAGFVQYVNDKNGNLIGSVSHGKYVPLIDSSAAKPSTKSKPSILPNGTEAQQEAESEKQTQWQHAQQLSAIAAQQYGDLQNKIHNYSSGNGSPGDKKALEFSAKQYELTIQNIQDAYQKSGAVQGSVNLNADGTLVKGTQIVNPTNGTNQVETVGDNNQLKPVVTPTGIGTPTTGVAANQNTGGTAETLDNATQNQGKVSTASSTSPNHIGGFTPVSQAQLDSRGLQGPDIQNNDQAQQDFVNKYGGIAAWAAATPWMDNYLKQAIQGNWTVDKFTQAIHADANWQNVGQSMRDYDTAFYGNAQAWAQQYNDKLTILQNSAKAQGYDPSIFGNLLPNNPTQTEIKAAESGSSGTNTFLQTWYGNTPDQTTTDRFVAAHATVAKQADGFTPEGQIASTAAGLKAYAQSMGINPTTLPKQWTGATGQGAATGDYFTSAADAIAKGYTTAEGEQAMMRSNAQQIYKPFAQQIGNGVSVAQLAQPYVGAAANLLEKDPTSFTIGDYTGNNGLLTKALQGDGQNPIPLDQFMTQIKGTSDWLGTANARNSLMDTATSLLHSFGMVN